MPRSSTSTPHGIRSGYTADAISAGPITRSTGSTPLGKVLFEGDRSEFEEPDSGNLDLRGITPDPVREKMRELGLRMERDDSHDSNGDDSDEEYWCKYDQGELRDLHRSRLALYAHVDRTAGTVAIVDVETGKQATLGFDKLLKLNRVEYGKRRACS